MKNNGFSVIELLLVMSLIAIMMVYGYQGYQHSRISVEAEIDRQFILQLPILLEDNYAQNLAYPNQLSDIMDSSNDQTYTPKSYYQITYKKINHGSYQIGASLNLKKNGTQWIECAHLNLDETGQIRGFDKSGRPANDSCLN